MTTLKRRSIQSIIWNGVGVYTVHATTFLSAALLGRLLTPADFGLAGIVLTINTFLVLFSNAGLVTTVVQRREFGEMEIRALIGLASLFGSCCALGLILMAPGLALLFNEERIAPLAIALAPSLLLTAFAQVPMGCLQRDLRFKEVALANAASAIVGAGCAIVVAFRGGGAWALILQILARTALLYLISALFARGPWRPSWRPDVYKGLLGFTGNLTLFQIVNYVHRNIDNILVAKFIGLKELGYYTRAYSLLLVFNQAIGGVLQPVLHSVLARLKDDATAMRKVYAVVLSLSLAAASPTMAGLAVFAPEVIRIVWGPGWDNSVGPFFWLALAGMHQTIFSTIGAVFAATNNTRGLLLCGCITTLIFAGAIMIGLRDGIVGVARCYSIASHATFPVVLAYVWRNLLKGTFRELWPKVAPPLLAGWIYIGLFEAEVLNMLLGERADTTELKLAITAVMFVIVVLLAVRGGGLAFLRSALGRQNAAAA